MGLKQIKNLLLIRKDASKFNPKTKFDAVLFSYSISMIPEWQKTLKNFSKILSSGGRLVIVDFGLIKGIIGNLLNWWLKIHGVNNKQKIEQELKEYFKKLHRGYNYIAKCIK